MSWFGTGLALAALLLQQYWTCICSWNMAFALLSCLERHPLHPEGSVFPLLKSQLKWQSFLHPQSQPRHVKTALLVVFTSLAHTALLFAVIYYHPSLSQWVEAGKTHTLLVFFVSPSLAPETVSGQRQAPNKNGWLGDFFFQISMWESHGIQMQGTELILSISYYKVII